MKNYIFILSLFAICFTFGGCPYEAPIPIDSPSVKINPSLIGNWEDKKNNEAYKVGKKDEYTYIIEQTSNRSDKKDTLFAYTSMVNGTSFLNIYKNGNQDPSKKFSFFKMQLLPDGTILISEITENIDEHFTWSADLKKFIIANMHNSYFFGKEEINLIRSDK